MIVQTDEAESTAASCHAIENHIYTRNTEAATLDPLANVNLTGRVRNVSEK
jgi:hypothetical protein